MTTAITSLSFAQLRKLNVYWVVDPFWKIPYDGSKSAVPALNNLFAEIPDGSDIHCPRTVVLALDQPWMPTDREEIEWHGYGRPKQKNSNAPRFVWTGKDGGEMVFFNAGRDCVMRGMYFDSRGARRPLTVDTVPDAKNTRDGIGTRCAAVDNWFHNERLDPEWVGLSFSRIARENQEYHAARGNVFSCPFGAEETPQGIGIQVGNSSNAKAMRFTENNFYALNRGIDGQYGGGYFAHGNNWGWCETDLATGNAMDSITEQFSNSEHSRRHLVCDSAGTYTLKGSRFSIERTRKGTGYHRLHRSLEFIHEGNAYDSPPPDGATLFENAPYAGCLHSKGNRLSGDGMTMAQLGLELNRHAFVLEESGIRDAPNNAKLVVSGYPFHGLAAAYFADMATYKGPVDPGNPHLNDY